MINPIGGESYCKFVLYLDLEQIKYGFSKTTEFQNFQVLYASASISDSLNFSPSRELNLKACFKYLPYGLKN